MRDSVTASLASAAAAVNPVLLHMQYANESTDVEMTFLAKEVGSQIINFCYASSTHPNVSRIHRFRGPAAFRIASELRRLTTLIAGGGFLYDGSRRTRGNALGVGGGSCFWASGRWDQRHHGISAHP